MEYEVHGEAIHVTFPQQELVFIGDRWKEVGGDLTAEVTVRTTVAGLPPHVHQARLRLNSTAGSETFAKYCSKRWQGLDWREWLDMVEDDDISMTLEALGANLKLAAQQLVQMANDNGGKDNVSVILVRVLREYPAARGVMGKFLGWLK